MCVRFAVLEFQDKFHDTISQLLHTFPLDHRTSDGSLFWSGPKRPPAPIRFNPADPLHIEFVTAAANLYAANLGASQFQDREAISKSPLLSRLPNFSPRR